MVSQVGTTSFYPYFAVKKYKSQFSIFSFICFNRTYCKMIKNMLTRRRENNTYLAIVSRHRWSRQITMKIDEMQLSVSTVAFINFRGSLSLQLMKATVLAESYILSIFIVICLQHIFHHSGFPFILIHTVKCFTLSM